MDDKLLLELWPTQLPERILEIRLGRPSSAIYRRAHALGLPLRIPLRERLYGVNLRTLKRREQRARRRAREYDGQDDFAKSLEVGYAAIRERQAAGGPGWEPR
jgi:hypothetical protein